MAMEMPILVFVDPSMLVQVILNPNPFSAGKQQVHHGNNSCVSPFLSQKRSSLISLLAYLVANNHYHA